MIKVGILSMQRIKNYGSFLQAYGLKKILESFDCKVEFVDYKVEKPLINSQSNNKKYDKISKALAVLSGKAPLKQKIQFIIHKKKFGKRNYPILELTQEPNYNPELDMLVIGSDEVFNCIQENTNVGYSLELFGKNNKAKRVITYAASFGNTTYQKLKKYKKNAEIGNLLSNIESISVRDKNSGEIVEKLTEKKVVFNLDPVLVYDYINQKELIPEIKVKEKYILLYAYSGRISQNESKYIKKYAKENKLKIYSIGGVQKCADRFIDCTPFEIFSYFKNAELIITDTFHGSIFSIVTQKKFLTLVRKSVGTGYGNEEKLTDLLERLELSDRIIYNINELDEKINKKIDYKITSTIIKKEREKAYDYLRKELEKCTQS